MRKLIKELYPQICKNGHLDKITDIFISPKRPYCSLCGEQNISQCTNCRHFITVFSDAKNNVPNYCFSCGNPFPWTEKLLNNAVNLVSLDEGLTEEQKFIIKNAIPDLIIESSTTPVAQAKYKKYMSNAAEYVQEGTRNLLIDVVSESVKKSLFS